jgi:MscS family membrane protein
MPSFPKVIYFVALSLAVCLPLSKHSLAQLPGTSSSGAPAKSSDQLGRESPYGTVFGFLQAAQSGNYSIAAQYLQMSPSRRQTDGDAMAMKLNVVMNRAFNGSLRPSRQAEGTPQEDVPLDRQRLGTMSSGDVEDDLELVRVNDPSAGRIWLIASNALTKVPELYDQVEARRVETKLPAWTVKYQFAGMPLWQWFALLLLIPAAAVAAWLLLILLNIPLRYWAQRHGESEASRWRSVSAPAWLLVGALTHRIFATYLGLPLLQRHYYNQVVAVAVIVGTFWIFWRIIRWFLQRVRNQALARGHSGTGSLMLLGERIIKAVVFIVALFLIFGVLGFNMSTALAGVGIGTLAVGFGAQQTIANLFGGVSVLGDEVMRVGDVCKFGDRTGTVEDIGLRSTRVRTEERTLLAIPNGTVASINVENLSRRDKMFFRTILSLHADTSSDHVRYVLSKIRGVLTSFPKIETSSARVRLTEVTPASINVEVVCYVLTREFDEYATVREDLLLRIMNFVEDSGTNLATPSQTLYLSSDPGLSKDKVETKSADDHVDSKSANRLKAEAPLRNPKPSRSDDSKDD